METWMAIQGGGVLLGLLGLIGVVMTLRKAKAGDMTGGKKAGMIGGGVLLMLVGGFLVLNATAFAPTPPPDTGDTADVAPTAEDDFDAPL